MDLCAQGISRALADCGLTMKDVDGLFCAMTQQRMSIISLIEYLGIQPKFIGSSMTGGSSFEFHVAQAAAAIEAGPVQRGGDRLRLDPAQRRAQAGLAARGQPVRDAVQAVPADECLCARGLAPHASIRHDARAPRRGRGRGAQMGAAQSGRVGEEAAHRRGRAEVAHDLASVHGARLLPRHRRRRRDRDDVGGAREVTARSRRPMCSAAATASRT